MNFIGEKLKEIRMKKNFTQSELADGIANRSYISQIEKGIAQPSYKLLSKLSQRLECEIEDLIEEEQKVSAVLDIKRILSSLEYLIVNGEYSAAEEDLLEVELAIEKLNSSELALFYFCKGRLLEKFYKNSDKALSYYKKSYSHYAEMRMVNERIRSTNHLVEILLGRDQIHEAFKYMDEAYDNLIFYKISGIEKIALLINLGIAHTKQSEYYSAIRFLNQAIKTSAKTNLYYETGKAYMVLGLCQRRINRYDDAFLSYEKALLFFEGKEDKLNVAGTFTNLGILKRYQSENKSSIDLLKKANQIYIDLQDSHGRINTLYELSLTYFKLEEYPLIHDLYARFKRLQIKKEKNMLADKFSLLVADTLVKQEKYEEALTIYRYLLSVNLPPQFAQNIRLRLSQTYAKLKNQDMMAEFWADYIAQVDLDL